MIHRLSGLDLKCTQWRETVKWQICPYLRSDKRKAKNPALKAQQSESNLTSCFFFFLFSHLAVILLISGASVMGYRYQQGWLQSLYLALCIFTLTHSIKECLCLVYTEEYTYGLDVWLYMKITVNDRDANMIFPEHENMNYINDKYLFANCQN